MTTKYTPVIGLEIHVELATKSKMFCQCDADYFGKKPNSNTCPVCLGMPGALPVPNRTAIEWAIKIGQALNCTINKASKFDRKHYFYPDLPKAYQISQYDEPIAVKGHLEILGRQHPPAFGHPHVERALRLPEGGSSIGLPHEGSTPKGGGMYKRFGITRVHLEEDTGKLIHSGNDSLVDFNRSSVPLVEIVTEPDFENSEDVKIFLEELHTIIKYLDVSDANMEEGSMRMEPNISLMKVHPPSFGHPHVERALRLPEGGQNKDLPFEGSTPPEAEGGILRKLPNYKVEVKNINSFNFAKKAIEYELIRQAEILDRGETPAQETRGYDDKKGITFSQRSKEEAQDYRYFPEPDIPPMEFSDEEIEDIRKTLPELPSQKRDRFSKMYKLKADDVSFFVQNITASQVYEDTIDYIHSDPELSKIPNITQGTANIIINKLPKNELNRAKIISLAKEGYIKKDTDLGLLEQVISNVLSNNKPQIEQYKAGKTGLLGYFVGMVMKEMNGKADPQEVQKLMRERLS
ncbi:MAG: Asp-tRNA(Asn)/Glu-tRNA(Gln) amidotransferase subunit GatB [Candidatus Roizmanbacteria bacterium]|nr:Asp-tRNA(Asn)/Glu-tRNA(Gln) amidotransferase subunit GatB [Candidatus Roizmanbacteria bacterium]